MAWALLALVLIGLPHRTCKCPSRRARIAASNWAAGGMASTTASRLPLIIAATAGCRWEMPDLAGTARDRPSTPFVGAAHRDDHDVVPEPLEDRDDDLRGVAAGAGDADPERIVHGVPPSRASRTRSRSARTPGMCARWKRGCAWRRIASAQLVATSPKPATSGSRVSRMTG